MKLINVLSSYVENIYGSQVEAEIAGIPCVMSYVGRISSLKSD